jgi:cytochrome c biogenesis protein CcmG/thiol:disulfide interchange protein DsbE
MRRLIIASVLLLFVLLLVVLGFGLTRDPSRISSPLINKPMPEFSLSVLQQPHITLSNHDLLTGSPYLLNVWASWCAACRTEHPLLLQLAKQKTIPIFGLNYRDQREDANTWLQRLGDPYEVVLFDPEGRTGIDLGVYGAPETYVVDRNGVIVHKHIGPISPDDWRNDLQPVINRLLTEQP